jgi:glutathione peroxidase
MKKCYRFVALLACCLPLAVNAQDASEPNATDKEKEAVPAEQTTETAAGTPATPAALSFTMKSIDGTDVELSKYLGNVVVVVNTASRCGLTPQYKQLQELHANYAEKGVRVLGFPCNQFGGQEPGTEADIKTFCSKNYGVTFDMFSKVDVNGEKTCDFYKYLKAQATEPKGTGDIGWNFEKFILDKSGKPIARFGPRVKPDSAEFIAEIEKALKNNQ